MAIDSTIQIRRGMLMLAKADATLTAIVPAASIYPQTVPVARTFPFIRSGAPLSVPLRASCLDGGEWTVAMHVFAKDRMQVAKRVETAEDYAGRASAALARALDTRKIELPTGLARIVWTGSQLLMDPDEPACFHGVVNFRVRALTA